MAAGGFTGRGRKEGDASDTTPAPDEAFERMAAASFELPNGFVDHGVMACEALAVLDCAGAPVIGELVRRRDSVLIIR